MTDAEMRTWYMRYADALNAHDLDSMDEFIADDVLAGGVPAKREHVVAALRGIIDAVPDIRWDVEELLFDHDGIAVRATNTGTPAKEWLGVAASGSSFRIIEYAIYKVRDGRFIQMTNLHDSAELRRQLTA